MLTYADDHPELVQPLYAALDEMSRNVLEHSARSHGYVARQRYDARRDIAFAMGASAGSAESSRSACEEATRVAALLPPIEVPQLSGGRERARALIGELADRLPGATVVVDFRRVVAGMPSFADELVARVLAERLEIV